jgi:chromosome segregation ATPase
LKKAQEETSTLLQNRIAMEEESSELGSKLDAANRAHEADLFKSQQAIAELRAAISEMHNEQNVLKKSNLILQKRVEVDGEITSLQRKKDAATKAWQETMEYEIAALKNEADEANAELAWMREREAMRISEEESRLSIGKTFKGVFGRKMN